MGWFPGSEKAPGSPLARQGTSVSEASGADPLISAGIGLVIEQRIQQELRVRGAGSL